MTTKDGGREELHDYRWNSEKQAYERINHNRICRVGMILFAGIFLALGILAKLQGAHRADELLVWGIVWLVIGSLAVGTARDWEIGALGWFYAVIGYTVWIIAFILYVIQIAANLGVI